MQFHCYYFEIYSRPVVVKLNSGSDYRGILACLDGFMNIAMEQTEEYLDGQLKARYGDCFIRGNNGMFQCVYTYHLNITFYCYYNLFFFFFF